MGRVALSSLLLIVLAVAAAHAVVCPVSTCDSLDPRLPALWLNSTTMNSKFVGPQMTFFPSLPDGRAFEEAFSSIGILHIAELKLSSVGSCSTPGLTIETAMQTGRVARYLNMSEACCEFSRGEGMLNQNVHLDIITVNITKPDWPDFSMELLLSMPNDSITFHRPATPEIGTGYDVVYEYVMTLNKRDLPKFRWPCITWRGYTLRLGATLRLSLSSYQRFCLEKQCSHNSCLAGEVCRSVLIRTRL
jgi:hypothetical protein